ncbi:hypothetical protein GSI_10162 [Ganoderma sinense ZZ0214-1]|uniref:Fungal-type protein kinase domain-containing protein n=1 Tax=Ganoderma sinense ZZ0214-1 TaxID=1077348 RepID=A0A2G8RZS4_9APHY|nr:hypothetical protein GSI_10162 [Ganoderma sinense ZZ0214-1]
MLQHADALPETELSVLFMDAVNDKKLAPGFRISSFTHCAQTGNDGSPRRACFAMFRGYQDDGVRWFDQIIPFEFRQHLPGIDPFEDIQSSSLSSEVKRARARLLTEISACAELLFASQHRVSLLMFLVIGRRFRLLRLDRAGILVTPSVDYIDNPAILLNYLYRSSRLDNDSLGFDPSVTRVLPSDIDFLRMDRAALPDIADLDHSERDLKDEESCESITFAYVRSLFRATLASDWPRYRIRVPDGDQQRTFLVAKPAFRAGDFAGRGTRGYVALDCATCRFVWLKDAWRLSYKVADREGDILEKLNAANISNVPTLVCHGDIANQTTITADWWERKSRIPSTTPPSSTTSLSFTSSSTALNSSRSLGSKKRKRNDAHTDDTLVTQPVGLTPHATGCSAGPLREHTHYRVVVEEVCLHLKNFQYGQQLVSIVLDCMRAHYEAAVKPEIRILHRDISGGNILICPKILRQRDGKKRSIMWTGILSDWELSKPVDTHEAASRATRAHRMGTYQFMSVNLLSDLSRPVQIADELESFFHVLVYYAVRYLNSNCTSTSGFIQGYFDMYTGPGSAYACGQKSVAMESSGVLYMQHPYKPLLFRTPMDNLLATMLKSFRAHYKVLEYDARKTAPPQPPPTPHQRSQSPSDSGDGEDGPQVGPPTSSHGPPSSVSDVNSLVDWDNQDDTPVTSIPTAEDVKLAAKVAHHKFLLSYMAKMLDHPRWRMSDRRPATPETDSRTTDPAGSSHAPPSAASASASVGNGSKRRRLKLKGPERNVSLPARLHASTRRTPRTRVAPGPRTLPVKARS